MNNLCTKILVLFLALYSYTIYADSNPEPYSCIIDPEFADTPLLNAPLTIWSEAGNNAVIDSVFTIDVTAIPDSVSYESTVDLFYPVPSAIPDDDTDDSFSFNKLITWLNGRAWLNGKHTQIIIPSGVYNFSDQIIMSSNISLKGAGSHQTELRFLIRADSTSTSMSKIDCRKDAILVNGTGTLPAQMIRNVGIEDLKIVRIREGLSPSEVKGKVGVYSTFDGTGYQGYWGNNIAIRRGTNCWVKGVESEYTFRNHITLEYAHNNTISGVYFHDANDYGGGGYGYGVGVWDSSNNLVENNIFRHVRHNAGLVKQSRYQIKDYNKVKR